MCGYANIFDPKIIKREDLDDTIQANREGLEPQLPNIKTLFEKKKTLKNWELKSVLDYINGVLKVMYGCIIKSTAKVNNVSTDYAIKHRNYGKIFDKVPNDDIPYIELNWNHRFVNQ
jgi:hypothetical protein